MVPNCINVKVCLVVFNFEEYLLNAEALFFYIYLYFNSFEIDNLIYEL